MCDFTQCRKVMYDVLPKKVQTQKCFRMFSYLIAGFQLYTHINSMWDACDCGLCVKETIITPSAL